MGHHVVIEDRPAQGAQQVDREEADPAEQSLQRRSDQHQRPHVEQDVHEPQAAQAVELFCYQLRKYIGAMVSVLGGLDTLVFTGGIGEHAAAVRWEVCTGLAYLGIGLDAGQNTVNAEIISAPGSVCTVRVIPTNEDLMIARHTLAVLFSPVTTMR